MPYITVNSHLNQLTDRCFYSSTAGLFKDQVAHYGDEKSSTTIRGFLIAALDGFRRLENIAGTGLVVELLIPDETCAAKMRNAEPKMFSQLLGFDDRELWEQFVQRKQDFTVKILTDPFDGDELKQLWIWQRPLQASLNLATSNAPISSGRH